MIQDLAAYLADGACNFRFLRVDLASRETPSGVRLPSADHECLESMSIVSLHDRQR